MKENPLIPMGAVTGKPDRETIAKVLKSFREVGITQYLIYPRTGCELEYMSDEWFEVCKIHLEEAERLGYTSIWLYDEFNWPSGQCGGRIMRENADHALKFIQVLEKDGDFEFQLTSNPDRPNVLDPEAMRKFIAYTHEKYAEHFGHLFGTFIKGIFTDEPAFCYIWPGPVPENEKLRFTYYTGMEEEYAQRTGRQLREDIVFCLRTGSEPFWWPVVRELLGIRFKKSFAEPVRDWCKAHDLLMTGHLNDELTLARSAKSTGLPMEISDAFSLPGIDEIHTNASLSAEWITFGTIEHAIRKNGNGGLAELFAVGPCDMSLGKMRQMIRLAALFGIDRYVLAVSPLDMRGNIGKSQYFNPFTEAQPWFPAFELLGDSAAASASIAKKKLREEVQVRRPNDEYQLYELLIQLTQAQRQWTLIGEKEEGTAPVILHLDREGLQWENARGPGKWNSFSGFLAFLQKERPLSVYVSEPGGALISDLFLRQYEDGSVEVIDLSGGKEKRALILHRNGQEIPFELEPGGIRSFPGWKVEIDRVNLKRLVFEDGKCRLTVKEPLDDLTFVLRKYGPAVELRVDGRPVAADSRTDALPPGFAGLYGQTAQFRLEQGEHIIELQGGDYEYPYLPAVFLAGMFAEGEDRLEAYRNDGAGLVHYAGKLTQSGEIEIPVDALLLELETDDLYTEVFLDGESLGRRAWRPFRWRIPEHFAGKTAQLKIVRSTSCGPMFGEERFREQLEGDSLWLLPNKPSGGVRHPVVEPVFL